MINRAKMPRQLRNKGGITSVVPRTNYLFGGIKRRIRKLIPNELASVAVKAAPIVAPFNPGAAALMRGIGRFDQRGSISDALKQGIGTFAFGKGVGKLGGAQSTGEGFFGGQKFSMKGFQEGPIGSLFDKQAADKTFSRPSIKDVAGDKKNLFSAAKDLVKTGFKALPKGIEGQLIAGGLTAGASLLASYFQGEFEEPEPGESMEEYLARRREYVGTQMRTYMDNYFANDPEYMKLDDAGRDAFVARYNIRDGGRVGYQTGGITMANTLAENIARNKANQAAISKVFQAAASRAFPEGKFQQIKASSPTQKDYNIKATEDLVRNLPGGVVRDASASAAAGVLSLPYDAIQAATRTTESDINRAMQTGALTPRDIASEAFGLAYARENPLSSAIERTIGAAGPLAERLSQPDILDVGSDPLTETTPTPDSEFENTMRKITADSEGFAAYAGIVPGFKARKRSDGRFEYKAPDGQIYGPDTYTDIAVGKYPNIYDPRANVAGGGMPTGIMRVNKAGVMERDYRDKGGFVPVGIKEKADDVPAMLSKNEFVFTADAVRGAGNGSIERGAQKMYDTMKRLEKRVV